MIVVDTSALVLALADPSHRAARVIAVDGDLHAPHFLDVELVHTLRRLARTQAINDTQAEQLLQSRRELRIDQYPHNPFTDRMWALRHNLTAYDAAFVALAEALEVTLVTADTKLANAPGNDATILDVRMA